MRLRTLRWLNSSTRSIWLERAALNTRRSRTSRYSTRNDRLDALVGAIAEYLAKQRRLGQVPAWVCDPARRLAEPWFTASSPSDAMREYLTYASPAEFASRNIFTEERPLRRARGPHTAKV
ncbi:hypothetical protein [Bradyrhizobium sp. RDM4]|uniref:hypothetical protein n=1 Tax=Bradyrhizobium sp. RDM4 TaxID=3378765 RepID=UPI0038FC186C